MATTKITSNVLALSAAQTNINNDGSFTLSVPTLINNTVSVSGNLTVDTNTLFVDSVSNRVGIGTISPAVNFHVSEGISRFERSSVVFNITPNYTGLGNVALDVSSNNGIVFRTNNIDRAVISNTGSVGIGTLSALIGKLDVAGSPTTTTPSDVLVLSRPYNAGIGLHTAASFKLANPSSGTNNTRLDIALQQGNSVSPVTPDTIVMTLMGNGRVGIGTTTPNEKLTVTGNISANGNVFGNNLVYTAGDQTIAGAKTFTNDIVGNGTANRLPNQLAVASSDIITKGLADTRYTSRNERITDDTTFLQTTWEQFLDFDDQYNADLTLAAASGGTTFGASPAVFGDVWTTSNAGVTAFNGNDAHTHRGIFLVRGPTASSQAFYIGINRTTIPYNLTNRIDEFTCRVFVGSTDFRTQGYFKIGIIPKGGTGGADQSLRGGLIFNPYLNSTNLVLGVNKAATASPYTFTTTSANVDFLDTGVNFIDLLDKWVNITYRIDRSVGPTITIIITRENVILFQASYNIATDPVVSTWARRADLYLLGASNEIGIQNGKFTYTTRSQLHIDYLYYKVTGTSAAPSNWNSLRF